MQTSTCAFCAWTPGGKTGDRDEVKAAADEEPPGGGINPRPEFKAKINEPLLMQFILTNAYPHGELKDVTVRYFVVREDKIGQKKLPIWTRA